LSGERRHLACGVWQPAKYDLVGKLPTNEGWQPALPRMSARHHLVNSDAAKVCDISELQPLDKRRKRSVSANIPFAFNAALRHLPRPPACRRAR
jgi:hypothetical protein